MNPLFSCFFRGVASLALLGPLLSRAQAGSVQPPAGQPSYQATGLRAVIKAQPNSALVRVRYEHNNSGPVYVEFVNAQRLVVYSERKRETHFVGDYNLTLLPAGDYTLHLSTSGFHHVEALRLTRKNNALTTVQVIRPAAFHLASQALLPAATTP